MPTRDEFVKEVSHFFVQPKRLGGIGTPAHWQPNRDPAELCLKLPIEIDGVLSGQTLVIVSYPSSPNLRFTILIVFEVAVARLDFDETGGHTNGFLSHLDGLASIVPGSHFHRWSLNTRFVEGNGRLEELKHAEPLPVAIRNFDAALRWFCDETGIALPHNHLIDLPPKVLI